MTQTFRCVSLSEDIAARQVPGLIDGKPRVEENLRKRGVRLMPADAKFGQPVEISLTIESVRPADDADAAFEVGALYEIAVTKAAAPALAAVE